MTIADAIDAALKRARSRAARSWQEPIYRQVLAHDPENADALHLLGVLMHQAGKTAAGIEPIERALGR